MVEYGRRQLHGQLPDEASWTKLVVCETCGRGALLCGSRNARRAVHANLRLRAELGTSGAPQSTASQSMRVATLCLLLPAAAAWNIVARGATPRTRKAVTAQPPLPTAPEQQLAAVFHAFVRLLLSTAHLLPPPLRRQ